MKLDARSRKYVVLFRYTRLPYGVSSAPSLFQRQMLRGIPGVVVYMDDILITGQTEVLTEASLRAKKSKCHFMEPQVVFLGHVVGLHPMPSKMKAIQEAPKPRNVTELKSYLGLLTYYGSLWRTPYTEHKVEVVYRPIKSVPRIQTAAHLLQPVSSF